MKRNRKVKIVATLGPASSTYEMIRQLHEAGADVFRLNFSHGQHEDHRKRVEQLRALEKEYKHPIAILMDLQGPKLRLGTFAKGPMELKKGQYFIADWKGFFQPAGRGKDEKHSYTGYWLTVK